MWRLWAVATLGTPLNQRKRMPKKFARLMCVWITSIRRWRTSWAIRRNSSVGQRCKSERTTSIPSPAAWLPIHAPGRQTSVTAWPRRANSRLSNRQWRMAPLTRVPETISMMFIASRPPIGG